jgi:hypothetical protein
VWASLTALNTAIAADPRCIVVADSAAHERGEDFILQLAIAYSDLPLYFLEPVRMTTRYPFG